MATITSPIKNKNVILAFILGIIVTVFVGHAVVVYQTRNLAVENRNDINSIMTFLQQATGGAPVAPAGEVEEAE